MNATNKIFSVSYAEAYDTKHKLVVFTIEASHEHTRTLCRESERVKIINAKNLKEHDTLEEAKLYVETLSQAHHDAIQLRKEQGI